MLRHEGQIFDNFTQFRIFLSIKVIKILLDSMLYETLKWHQIAFTCKGGDGYVAIFPGEILLYSHFPPDKEGGKMAI